MIDESLLQILTWSRDERFIMMEQWVERVGNLRDSSDSCSPKIDGFSLNFYNTRQNACQTR